MEKIKFIFRKKKKKNDDLVIVTYCVTGWLHVKYPNQKRHSLILMQHQMLFGLFKNRNTQNKRQERMQQREKEIQKNISFILVIKMIRRKKRKKKKV